MRYFSHLNTAVKVLDAYDGKIPFHHYIKEFLRLDKKYGSKDRRNISRLCYACLRLGNSFSKWTTENRIRAGLFLCSAQPDDVTRQLLGDHNEIISQEPAAKWNVLAETYNREFGELLTQSSIFPLPLAELSAAIDKDAFLASFFIQPDLFLRIRPGQQASVFKKLEAASIPFHAETESAVRLPINSRVNEVLVQDKEIVIQDLSSQETASIMKLVQDEMKSKDQGGDIPGSISESVRGADTSLRVWDACAASGGKSILLTDIFGPINLTVTDVRNSILHNLSERFRIAGIRQYTSHLADLSVVGSLPVTDMFDLVIADVPCSGSGTWSRTPEQLRSFNIRMLNDYQQLQRKIVTNIIPHMQENGFLVYITCSAFAKENEENTMFIRDELGLTRIEERVIKGYHDKADTMFTALFRK